MVTRLRETLEIKVVSQSGMPGNQPHSSRAPAQKATACQRMATRRVEHAVAVCPDCGTSPDGGWVQRTREVIELPVAPVEVPW